MRLNVAKHLPPSLDVPNVLVLDEATAASLPPELNLTLQQDAAPTPNHFDAVVGANPSQPLSELYTLLRPGGRLILVAPAGHSDSLLAQLNTAGFIHCLVETEDGLTLYRGERPPTGSPIERIQTLTSNQQSEIYNQKFIFLLVSQSPNKPAWRLAPGETITWQAATVLDPQTQATILLAFTSLVRAVKFMQPAVLAQVFKGINKVGKFPASVAETWSLPFLLNPEFDELRTAAPGPWFTVDPQVAITGEE